MSGVRVTIFVAILAALAAVLRFERIGAWSFANDEVVTFAEVDSLFQGPADPENLSPEDRLPRMLPVSYSLLGLGYGIFGRDEGGSRAMGAIFGAVSVLLTFLLLRRPLGTAGAAAVALLVALWPEHVSHSQQNRFYMFAWFFGSLAMLCGARALKDRSRGWLVSACVASILAVLSHTVLLLVALMLPVALAAGLIMESRRKGVSAKADLRKLLPIPCATIVVLLAICVLYVRPLMASWNSDQQWGYGPAHSLLSTVQSIGLPLVLCALPGALLALRWRDGQGLYWLCFAFLAPATAVALPMVIVHHPHYVFPFLLGALVCVGFLVQWVAEMAVQNGHRLVPGALAVALALVSLPSLVSYYRDGARDDFRGVSRFIAEHWREGDRLVGPSPALFHYYSPWLLDVEKLHTFDVDEIRRRASRGGRCWIVVRTNRNGIPEPARTWLGENCRWPYLASTPRLDYSDHRLYVFLHDGAP